MSLAPECITYSLTEADYVVALQRFYRRHMARRSGVQLCILWGALIALVVKFVSFVFSDADARLVIVAS